MSASTYLGDNGDFSKGFGKAVPLDRLESLADADAILKRFLENNLKASALFVWVDIYLKLYV